MTLDLSYDYCKRERRRGEVDESDGKKRKKNVPLVGQNVLP